MQLFLVRIFIISWPYIWAGHTHTRIKHADRWPVTLRQSNITMERMYVLLNLGIFHCYVSLPEGTMLSKLMVHQGLQVMGLDPISAQKITGWNPLWTTYLLTPCGKNQPIWHQKSQPSKTSTLLQTFVTFSWVANCESTAICYWPLPKKTHWTPWGTTKRRVFFFFQNVCIFWGGRGKMMRRWRAPGNFNACNPKSFGIGRPEKSHEVVGIADWIFLMKKPGSSFFSLLQMFLRHDLFFFGGGAHVYKHLYYLEQLKQLDFYQTLPSKRRGKLSILNLNKSSAMALDLWTLYKKNVWQLSLVQEMFLIESYDRSV